MQLAVNFASNDADRKMTIFTSFFWQKSKVVLTSVFPYKEGLDVAGADCLATLPARRLLERCITVIPETLQFLTKS